VLFVLVSDWRSAVRVTSVFVLAAVVLAAVVPRMLPQGIVEYRLSFGDNYQLSLKPRTASDPELSTHLLLLPASRPWVDTGIELDQGDVLTIKYLSGGVNLGAHRLWEAADLDHKPALPWIYFDSQGTSRPRASEEDRKGYRLKREAPYGALLMYIPQHDTLRPDPEKKVRLRPLESRIQVVGLEGIAGRKVETAGPLYLSVNDIIVDSKEVYMTSDYEKSAREIDSTASWDPRYAALYESRWNGNLPKPADLRKRRELLWNSVVSTYPTIWFDDNVGCYLVWVEVEEEKEWWQYLR